MTQFENVSLKIENFNCFADEPAGFEQIKPINIIIGKNNSGKSSLITMLENAAIEGSQNFVGRDAKASKLLISTNLTTDNLKHIFPAGSSGGAINGSHWTYGARYVGSTISWKQGFGLNAAKQFHSMSKNFEGLNEVHANKFGNDLSKRTLNPFQDIVVKRICAERDITAENQGSKEIESDSHGRGLTNSIRLLLNRNDYPTELIEEEFLNELNKIVQPDMSFDTIRVQSDINDNLWEIHFSEADKKDIPLSQMGSGIKTVMAVVFLCHTISKIPQKRT